MEYPPGEVARIPRPEERPRPDDESTRAESGDSGFGRDGTHAARIARVRNVILGIGLSNSGLEDLGRGDGEVSYTAFMTKAEKPPGRNGLRVDYGPGEQAAENVVERGRPDNCVRADEFVV